MQSLTFVRKDFYIEPPKNGTAEEWESWLKKDNRKAAAAKAKHTRFTNKLAEEAGQIEMPEATMTMKIGGVYKQVSPIGFNGSAEDGNMTVEPIVDSIQEQQAILARMEKNRNIRGGQREGKSARRRKNRKNR